MSKLIVNTGTLLSGGAERVLSSLSKAFADSYDEVEYIMWKPSEVFYEIDPRVKITSIVEASGSKKRIKHMLWFRRKVKREQPSMILSFMMMINYIVTFSLIGVKCRIVVSERNDPRIIRRSRRRWRKFCLWLYERNNVKGLVVQTQNNRNYYSNKLKNKTKIISNPINISSNLVGLGLNTKKENIVVSVGRLSKQKNHILLLDAFHIFYQTHKNFKLIIYGEGSYRDLLEKKALEYDISDALELPGIVKDIPNSIASAKIFVLSSNFEGMPNALLEAMSIGLPCISTQVSGSSELIQDKQNGILVEVKDVKGMAVAMSYLADNEVISKELAQKATKVYAPRTVEEISKIWVDYLQSLE